ncbi:leucine-rich repeat-containing protein 27 [Perognathus longimembris pacificus]|uniref:leucine-rich repeat-containing protein 27 n=1 Tax=Perognathus longimembris pacificus TaxID=214514 RepID=UPI0020193449|nr:leucine-rich repeat-containing protein 27 [Perognathus longimembris pacificus]
MVSAGGQQMEEGSAHPAASWAVPNIMEAHESPARTKSLPASPYKEVHKDPEEVICPPSLILDLSSSGLSHVGEALKTPNLQQLYLQRNALCAIPGDFFQRLPSLTWLDLRFNKIREIPTGIGSHKHLKTLLLERNPIKMLPVELGNVATLKALNLRHCPLEFPPQLIVQKGLLAILTFLRICAADNSSRDTAPPPEASPAKKTGPNELPALGVALPPERVSAEEAVSVPEAVLKGKDNFLPPVDRHDPSELRMSTDPSEQWPSKEEIRRFWKLRQEIVENGKTKLPGNQLLPVELPPNIRAALKSKDKDYPRPRDMFRRKTASFKSIFPALTSQYQMRLEESRMAALREIQEKQALAEQRRRDRKALQEWREQAQMKRKKKPPSILLPLQKNTVAPKIPFTTNLVNQGQVPTNPLERVKQRKERPVQERTDASASRLADLEERIRQHIKQLQAHRRLQGTDLLQEVRTAIQDLETAKKLQAEVMKLKLESTSNKGHPLSAALSGSRSRHSPEPQPQNVFFDGKS